jgi:flagellar motility protein MotE (MotC chaperone)
MTSAMKKSPRFIRLLPSVMVLGVLVWGLKASDLVHEAYGQASSQASSQAAAISGDPVPANKDYAGGEGDQVASASEVDVMNSLSKRRRELDKREGQLTTQANMIAAAEQRVDAKIAQLKQLQAQITQLLGQRDEAQKAQVTALVKTYSIMKPKDAARIFNNLPDEVLVPVARDMKSDQLALVLASMNPDNAKALTIKLANRLVLPQATDAAPAATLPAPSATAAGPAPMPAAAKAPVAGQNPATPKT